eukprot:9484195-Pyramimonas_sp.AAC.4
MWLGVVVASLVLMLLLPFPSSYVAAEPYMRGAAKAEIARTGKVSRTPPRPAAETPNDPYN